MLFKNFTNGKHLHRNLEDILSHIFSSKQNDIKHILMVRHAQSVTNSMNQVGGSSNSDLTEHGINQCKKFREIIKDHINNFDKIHSSPKLRAHKTANNIIFSEEINSENTSIDSNFNNLNSHFSEQFFQNINNQVCIEPLIKEASYGKLEKVDYTL